MKRTKYWKVASWSIFLLSVLMLGAAPSGQIGSEDATDSDSLAKKIYNYRATQTRYRNVKNFYTLSHIDMALEGPYESPFWDSSSRDSVIIDSMSIEVHYTDTISGSNEMPPTIRELHFSICEYDTLFIILSQNLKEKYKQLDTNKWEVEVCIQVKFRSKLERATREKVRMDGGITVVLETQDPIAPPAKCPIIETAQFNYWGKAIKGQPLYSGTDQMNHAFGLSVDKCSSLLGKFEIDSTAYKKESSCTCTFKEIGQDRIEKVDYEKWVYPTKYLK
jgi:hypothetical protein